MNYITDVMFWVSNGLLIPVIVGLIILFFFSLLLLGGLWAARSRYRAHLKQYATLFDKLRAGDMESLKDALSKSKGVTPFEKVALELFTAQPHERGYLIDNYELELERRLSTAKLLTKFGPILGLMGTLIPMGPALVGLGTGDIAGMAYNMQVAFATTVLGMFSSGIGYLVLQVVRSYNQKGLIWLDLLNNTLDNGTKL
jgi:biopolymer transport protein ExbB/TolQ